MGNNFKDLIENLKHLKGLNCPKLKLFISKTFISETHIYLRQLKSF